MIDVGNGGMRAALILLLASPTIVGCASGGATSYVVPQSAPASSAIANDYRIGPLDTLTITVFQVADLSLKEVQVDAGGMIAVPLIGSVTAAGKTTAELSSEIALRLKEGYLQSPQVSVIVNEAVSQKVTVDGAVTEPGVFQLKGRTTLMQAVAMAKGPGRNANLKRVAVFRTSAGQRTAAVFDLAAIRAGLAEDPEIYGNDVVVVDASLLKGVLREVVTALPAFSIFRPY